MSTSIRNQTIARQSTAIASTAISFQERTRSDLAAGQDPDVILRRTKFANSTPSAPQSQQAERSPRLRPVHAPGLRGSESKASQRFPSEDNPAAPATRVGLESGSGPALDGRRRDGGSKRPGIGHAEIARRVLGSEIMRGQFGDFGTWNRVGQELLQILSSIEIRVRHPNEDARHKILHD